MEAQCLTRSCLLSQSPSLSGWFHCLLSNPPSHLCPAPSTNSHSPSVWREFNFNPSQCWKCCCSKAANKTPTAIKKITWTTAGFSQCHKTTQESSYHKSHSNPSSQASGNSCEPEHGPIRSQWQLLTWLRCVWEHQRRLFVQDNKGKAVIIEAAPQSVLSELKSISSRAAKTNR